MNYKNLVAQALALNESPFTLLVTACRVAGMTEEKIESYQSDLHRWLWEHRLEYGFSITPPRPVTESFYKKRTDLA